MSVFSTLMSVSLPVMIELGHVMSGFRKLMSVFTVLEDFTQINLHKNSGGMQMPPLNILF